MERLVLLVIAWERCALPGCMGWPAERLRAGGRIAYVWRASEVTARGVWCWRLDAGGGVHTVRGNRGVAKRAAAAALGRAPRGAL